MPAHEIAKFAVHLFRLPQILIFVSAALLPVVLILWVRAYAESGSAATAYLAGAGILAGLITLGAVWHRHQARGDNASDSSASGSAGQGGENLNFPWDVRDTGLSFEIRDTAQRRIAFVWYVPPDKEGSVDAVRLDRATAERVATMIVRLSHGS